MSEGIIEVVSTIQRYKICKQFTTGGYIRLRLWALFLLSKDTRFVSNSQLDAKTNVDIVCCFYYPKIQDL